MQSSRLRRGSTTQVMGVPLTVNDTVTVDSVSAIACRLPSAAAAQVHPEERRGVFPQDGLAIVVAELQLAHRAEQRRLVIDERVVRSDEDAFRADEFGQQAQC